MCLDIFSHISLIIAQFNCHGMYKLVIVIGSMFFSLLPWKFNWLWNLIKTSLMRQACSTIKPVMYGTPNPQTEMFLVSSCSCICPIHWRMVFSWEWRWSWSSASGDAPTTSEWSTILLPTKMWLILEVWQYLINVSYHKIILRYQVTSSELKWDCCLEIWCQFNNNVSISEWLRASKHLIISQTLSMISSWISKFPKMPENFS